MDILDWDDYIHVPLEFEHEFSPRMDAPKIIEEHKKNLRDFLQKHRPRRIACLGSGSLSDIPIREFLHEESEVYLIDWVPSISLNGFKSGLISRDDKIGQLCCFICESLQNPEKFCSGFSGPLRDGHQGCTNFAPTPGSRIQCDNYLPGSEPRFITADVTAGRASHFGRAGRVARCRRSNPPRGLPDRHQ